MTNDIIRSFTTVKEGAGLIIATLFTSLSSLLGVQGPEMNFLLVLMIGDYASGIIVAGVFKKSKKSCDGSLESSAGIKGLFRKGMMLFIIYTAAQLDTLFNVDFTAKTIVYFFITNEGLSILENTGLMGVNYPTVIKNAISALSKKGDETE